MKNKKIIIKCPECGQKLRLPFYKAKEIVVRCPKCNTRFPFNYKKFNFFENLMRITLFAFIVILFSANMFIAIKSIEGIKRSLNFEKTNYLGKMADLKKRQTKEVSGLSSKYSRIISQVDQRKLKKQAARHYSEIWRERSNYNSKYAITKRERAKLEMLKLSKMKNKKISEIVRLIAMKAAPPNSKINVRVYSTDIVLGIDFNMSELTGGEAGTNTKHETLQSLKREVISLISKVTYDMYEYCYPLGLSKIYIGLRHYVQQEDQFGTKNVVNEVIYKVSLNTKKVKKLENNPFLDKYSTMKYLQTEEDKFSSLRIVRTKHE